MQNATLNQTLPSWAQSANSHHDPAGTTLKSLLREAWAMPAATFFKEQGGQHCTPCLLLGVHSLQLPGPLLALALLLLVLVNGRLLLLLLLLLKR